MAKALVLAANGFQIVNGNYTLNIEAMITTEKWSDKVMVNVSAQSLKPLLNGWQELIRDAIVVEAQKMFGQTVDEVMFPDFTVLGVL